MSVLSHLGQTLQMVPGLLIGLTVHEFAHAWSSSLLGDDFARRQGRVSLNPLRHLTPLGTLAILLLPFGWGKPVPVNLYNYRHPKRDYLLSSLAGPAANVLMVVLALGLLQLTRHCYALGDKAAWWMAQAHSLLMTVVVINAVLAMVNLIPIPPLDGSKIWPCLIPGRRASFTAPSSRWLMIVVFVLLARGTFNPLFGAVIGQLYKVMPASDAEVAARGALAASKVGRHDQAEALLSKVLLADPGKAEYFHARANTRGEQHKWQGALEDINQAIRLQSDHAAYYGTRAYILAQFSRLDEIKKDMEMYERLGGKRSHDDVQTTDD